MEEQKKKRVVKRTPALKAREARYKAKNQKNVTVAFLPPTMKLYEYLTRTAEEHGLKPAQYIRELIRADMEKSKED